MIRVSFPLNEVMETFQYPGADKWEWTCRICGDDGSTDMRDSAAILGIRHLVVEHGANRG
jgi:hypothetical protein